LIKHLATEKHQTYIRQKENYVDLFGVIKSLPKWKDLNADNDLSDSSESDEDEGDTSLNLTSSSLSSTTITLTSGSAKALGSCVNIGGSFFPLHDYITIKSRLSQQSAVREGESNHSPPNKLRKKLKEIDHEDADEVIEGSCTTPPHLDTSIFRYYSNCSHKTADLKKLDNYEQKELLQI